MVANNSIAFQEAAISTATDPRPIYFQLIAKLSHEMHFQDVLIMVSVVAMVQLGSGAEAQATLSGLETAGAEKPTPSLTGR